jgi:hypothetical protein
MNIKSKIASSLCAGYALVSLLGSAACAQDVTAKLGNVNAVSLDKMVLTNNGAAYIVTVGITFQNNNAESIKFRNANLEVSLKSERPDGTNEVVDLGPAQMDEIVLPGGSAKAPGTVSASANIVLGSTNEATNVKLVKLFNAVGDPGNKMTLMLNGFSELGLQLSHGWVYEVGKRFEVELSFTPTIQRTVLLN